MNININRIKKQSTQGHFQLIYTKAPDGSKKRVSAQFNHSFAIEGKRVQLIEITQEHLRENLIKDGATSVYMMFDKSSQGDCVLIGVDDEGNCMYGCKNKYFDQDKGSSKQDDKMTRQIRKGKSPATISSTDNGASPSEKPEDFTGSSLFKYSAAASDQCYDRKVSLSE